MISRRCYLAAAAAALSSLLRVRHGVDTRMPPSPCLSHICGERMELKEGRVTLTLRHWGTLQGTFPWLDPLLDCEELTASLRAAANHLHPFRRRVTARCKQTAENIHLLPSSCSSPAFNGPTRRPQDEHTHSQARPHRVFFTEWVLGGPASWLWKARVRKAAATEDVRLVLNVRLIGNLLVCHIPAFSGLLPTRCRALFIELPWEGQRLQSVCVCVCTRLRFLPGLKCVWELCSLSLWWKTRWDGSN